MTQADMFNDPLSAELADNLRGLNPHWVGLPGPQIPAFQRHLLPRIYRSLNAGLTPATVLRGTRRVGKTILVRQIMEKLLAEGVEAGRILYVPFDEIGSLRRLRDPILTIVRWYEAKILGCTLNESARSSKLAYALFDDVQNLDAWAPQIKHVVDNNTVRVLLTGSSSLRIEAGRDSLAGRIATYDLGPLLLREIAELSLRQSAAAHWKDSLAANIGWSRILTYLRFLDGTLLIRLVPAMELRLKKRKAPAKICLSDHSLRASWLQEIVPLDPDGLNANPHLTDLAGYLAESVLGYFLGSIPNLDLAYFPPRGAEPEVDFVLTVGTRRIPIEVKYRRRIDPHDDTRGLRAFVEKSAYNAPFGLLVTLEDDVRVPDPRIVPISLSALLWMR